ncbi:MAG TPA: TIGR03435 family protein [Vicinamibacterales bacterium]|nr:TIGR03435 family protein [Vicinamibacterales bacterium]
MTHRISRWNLAPTIALAVLLGHVVVTAQAGNAPVPAFEVAAIKINRSGEPRPRHAVIPASGQVTITNVTVRELIQDAYGVPSASLLINVPEWARTYRTGLTGRYDVDLTYTPSAFSAEALAQRAGATAPPGVDPAGPPLLTAVQEQLGLKLEPTRGPVNVLIIDRVEPLITEK